MSSGFLRSLFGSSRNVCIDDCGNSAIKEWNAATQTLTTLVSSGLSSPIGVAVDGAGNVFIADFGSNSIKEWHAGTQMVTTLAIPGLSSPYSIAVDAAGNLYVANYGTNSILEWHADTQTANGHIRQRVGSNGGRCGFATRGGKRCRAASVRRRGAEDDLEDRA
jgi:DNA-binding beta-propeller fold protein YncE